MNYDAFEATWLGKRDDYDGVYRYQCVDLIKRYLDQCYGIKPGAWGNAVDYWTNTRPEILAKFDRIKTTDVRRGDIVVIDVPTNTTIEHIAIATGYTTPYYYEVLEQNGVGGGDGLNGNAIRKYTRSKSKIIGVLRPKEVHMLTERGLYVIYRLRLGREPDPSAKAHYIGKMTFDQADADVVNSVEYKGYVDQAKNKTLELSRFLSRNYRVVTPPITAKVLDELNASKARIAELEKQLAASSGTYELISEPVYRRK